MAFSLNKVMLLGSLGRDAETRFTTGNISVTNFSIATEHSYKKNDEWVKETTWHNITGFNLSDWLRERLVKGAKVFLEGRLQKRDYTDKDGVKRYSVDIMLDPSTVIVLDSKGGGDAPSYSDVKEAQGSTGDGDDLPF